MKLQLNNSAGLTCLAGRLGIRSADLGWLQLGHQGQLCCVHCALSFTRFIGREGGREGRKDRGRKRGQADAFKKTLLIPYHSWRPKRQEEQWSPITESVAGELENSVGFTACYRLVQRSPDNFIPPPPHPDGLMAGKPSHVQGFNSWGCKSLPAPASEDIVSGASITCRSW